MRLNFKKIAAIGATVLLAGMTAGFASAAAFPAPFVQNGVANAYIVVGTGNNVSPQDLTEAGIIQTNLNGSLVGSSTSTVTVSGGAQALDQGGPSRIWLNTSLNTAKSIYTNNDFPTLLASTTFSGSATALVTQTLSVGAGTAGTGTNSDNSGKVIFDRMPTSNNDPAIGLSIGTSTASPIYNESVSFSQPINFASSQTQGQTITLFGNQYTVSSSSSASNGVVLYGSGVPPQTLNQGNSTVVNIGGVSYTIGLGSVSATAAQVTVNGVTQSINSGSTVMVNGLNIGIANLYPSSGVAGASATIIIGSNQLTFLNGAAVQVGTQNTPIIGTYVYLTGSVTALSGITVAVYAPNSQQNATILKGQTFVDPVFGSFGITNLGMSAAHFSPIANGSLGSFVNGASPAPNIDTITVGTSGSTGMTLAFTDSNNFTGNFPFVNNASGLVYLGTPSYSYFPYEDANITQYNYTLTGTGSLGQLDGHLLQLTQVYNASSGYSSYALYNGTSGNGYQNDYVQYYDQMSGQTFKSLTPTTVGVAPINIDNRQYIVTFGAVGTLQWAQLKYPGADEGSQTAATSYVLYPAIKTVHGAQLVMYQPLSLNITNSTFGYNTNTTTAFQIPNGAGYTSIPLTYVSTTNGPGNWTIGTAATGGPITFNDTGSGTSGSTGAYANMTVGQLKYNFSITANNVTNVSLYVNGVGLSVPAMILIEGKDIASTYNDIVVPENAGLGTSASGIGVGTINMTATTQFSAQSVTNTNLQAYLDYYGTLAVKNSASSSQPTLVLYYPPTQIYDQLYLGPTSSTVTTTVAGGLNANGQAIQLGSAVVKDSAISSVAQNNLIVVGGSCINSAAAQLLGVPTGTCGPAFTSATGIGSGQFLVQSFNSTFDLPTGTAIALLVAGYDVSDTVAATTWLTMQKPDTSLGRQYSGTSSTSTAITVH